MPVLSVGHSTRSLAELIELLKSNGVQVLVDVRTVPRSRRNPQFNRETLPAELAAAGLQYASMPRLGGLRRARVDSPNTGWRNLSFRGYADYMQTAEFEQSLNHLIQMQDGVTVAIMCAEAVPWRCHRSLIADALLARGIPVSHIMSLCNTSPHRLTPFARVESGVVHYPPPDLELFQP